MSVISVLIGGFLFVLTATANCGSALAQPEELKPLRSQRSDTTESTGAQSNANQLPATLGDPANGRRPDSNHRLTDTDRRAIDSDRGQTDSSPRTVDSDRRAIDSESASLDDRLRRLEKMTGGGATDLEQGPQINVPNLPKEKQKRTALRFGGSLCPTCLVYFEKKLYETGAVVQVEMSVVKKRPGQLAKVAIATVDYDPTKINKAELIEMVKHNDFQFMDATDSEIQQ